MADDDKEAELEEGRMPLLDHLIELRNRLMWAIGAILVAFLVCYQFKERIYRFLVHPLAVIFAGQTGRQDDLHRADRGLFHLRQGVVLGGDLPRLPDRRDADLEVRRARPLQERDGAPFYPYLFATPVLFLMGASLAYFVVIPVALRFFLSFETPPAPTAALPIVARGQGQRIPVAGDDPALRVWRRVSAAGAADPDGAGRVWSPRPGSRQSGAMRLSACSSFAAVLTPPDIISQTCLAIPLIILFEASIISCRMVEKARAKREAEEEAELAGKAARRRMT